MATERDFALPDLGEGLTEAELLSWRVAAGDRVELNQVIAEVETAKASVELPSPYAGTVIQLRAREGELVAVGASIITFAVDQPAPSPAPPSTPPSTPPAAPPAVGQERVPMLVGYGSTSGTASRRAGRAPVRPAVRPLAKPLVRKLARDLGVDLQQVPASGTGGVVTRQDVVNHVARQDHNAPGPSLAHPEAGVAPVEPAAAKPSLEERIPVRGVRRATAEAMVRSAFSAPHATEFVTIDVTATMELLHRLRASAFTDGVKLTPLAFAAKAMISALERNPTLNSSWDESAGEIVIKHYVNLGIAAATPRGLLVPNLKDAGRLGLIELARELGRLAAKARAGHCTPADLTGGTISLTNVGMFGIDAGTPILNPGEAAILCLGAVSQRPWVHEGALAVRWVTTLSLSFDHRLVDGEQAARYLTDVATALCTG